MYAQLVDDVGQRTLAAASDLEAAPRGRRRKKVSPPVSSVKLARQVGASIAAKAQVQKISRVVFDRGPYAYHGAVKALAEGAREGGLKF